MGVQFGCQSGAATMPHDHSGLNQGGILNPYSLYGAYREAYSGAATISLANNTERVKGVTSGAEIVKRTNLTSIVGGLQQGSFTIRYDYHQTLGVGFPIDIWVERWGSLYASLDFWSNDNSGYLTRSFTYTGTFRSGDYITIAVSVADAGNDSYFRNFQMNFGWRIRYFGDGTTRVLTAPLALSDTDNPFTYVAADP